MDEIETDVRTLLECLKCHQHQPLELSRSLMTLSSFITTNEGAKEYLQEEGGVEFLYKLLVNTKSAEVRHSCMFCLACAVDRNVSGQRILTNIEFFNYLHQILYDSNKSDVKFQQTCVFLLLYLVANNSVGQKLTRESKCLNDLIKMLRNLIQKNANGMTEDGNSKDIWCSVTSALSMCVNNPQNEDNQRECCVILPLAFQFIQNIDNPVYVRPLLAFIGLTVASNVFNQERVRKIGGIDVLVSKISDWLGLIEKDIDFLSLTVNAVNTLDSCIAENDDNCQKFVDLNGTNLLFVILQCTGLNDNDQLQIILALGHALQFQSDSNTVVNTKQQRLLVNILTEAQDEELMKATKYVLQNISVNEDINERNERRDVVNIERDTNNAILEKITELSRKLEILDDDIASRQGNKNKIENWLKKNEHSESSCKNSDFEMLNVGKTSSHQRHSNCECNEQNSKENEEQRRNEKSALEKETKKEFNKENMALMSMFADFLRSSFRLNDSNINNNSHMTCTPLREDSTVSAGQKDTLKCDINRDQSCSCMFLSCCNRTERPNNTENCTSFSYRNKSTMLQDCCHDHSNSNRNNNRVQEPTPISKLCKQHHHCQHSTPKEKFNPECNERNPNCIHAELCKYPEQSPIIDPLCGQEIYDGSLTVDHVFTPKTNDHDKDKTPSKTKILSKETNTSRNERIQCNEETQMNVNQSYSVNTRRDRTESTIKKIIPTDGSPDTSNFTGLANIDTKMKDTIVIDESKMKSRVTVPAKNSISHCTSNTNNINSHDGDLLEAIQSNCKVESDIPTFLVPSNPPIKRRVRHTPNLGSTHSTMRKLNVLTEISTPKDKICEEKMIRAIKNPSCPSPALSEFDLHLLRTAKTTNTAKHPSVNDNSIVDNKLPFDSPTLSTVSTILTNLSSQSPLSSVDQSVCTETDSHLDKSSEEFCEERETDGEQSEDIAKECPGCCIPNDNRIINSRTFNILVESSKFTCSFHRTVRNIERDLIRKYIEENNKAVDLSDTSRRAFFNERERQKDVYEFGSPNCSKNISSVGEDDCLDEETVAWRNRLHTNQERRRRVPYTQQEIENLIEGVKKMGRSWKLILLTFTFHPTRTSVDLKDKYRQLVKKEMVAEKVKTRKQKQPFSMCEERRLRRGIKLFGYNWKAILLNNNFSRTRTAEDLRNKWRNMCKAKMIRKVEQ